MRQNKAAVRGVNIKPQRAKQVVVTIHGTDYGPMSLGFLIEMIQEFVASDPIAEDKTYAAPGTVEENIQALNNRNLLDDPDFVKAVEEKLKAASPEQLNPGHTETPAPRSITCGDVQNVPFKQAGKAEDDEEEWDLYENWHAKCARQRESGVIVIIDSKGARLDSHGQELEEQERREAQHMWDTQPDMRQYMAMRPKSKKGILKN